MKKLSFSILLGIISFLSIYASSDVELYKSNFYSYYEDRCKANASINCLNKVHCGYNGKLVPGVYDNSLSYVTLLPSLNSIGNIGTGGISTDISPCADKSRSLFKKR